LDQLDVILKQPEPSFFEMANLITSKDMNLFSAICACSDVGSPTNSILEAVISLFNSKKKAKDLFEWTLIDEILQSGRTIKKITPNSYSTSVIRSDILKVPSVNQLGFHSMRISALFRDRYVELQNNSIKCYNSETDKEKPVLVIPLTPNTTVSSQNMSAGKIFLFEITTDQVPRVLGAPSEMKRFDWVNDLTLLVDTLKRSTTQRENGDH